MWKVIDKIGLFFVNLFSAIKFGVYDYDSKLRITKTNNQRIVIWITISVVGITTCFLLLFLAGKFIKTILDTHIPMLK